MQLRLFAARETAQKQSVAALRGAQAQTAEGRMAAVVRERDEDRFEDGDELAALGDACAQESKTVRYALDKRYMHSCRDNFLRASLHDGRLAKRDIGANINFFMNVPVTPEGGLTFEDGISAPGKYVELKAHMDVIVLISNCPQLNNPCNGYNPTPAEVLVWD